MELGFSQQQTQRYIRQRNILAIVAVIMLVILAVMMVLAGSRDREVILQPILSKPLTLSSSDISPEYMEMVTRDAALLTLNRSPENLEYWMNSVLALADPASHGKLKTELVKIVQEQSGSSISQFFTIHQLTVDPKTLTSEVNGVLHTVVGSKEVSAEARTFQFQWKYTGVSLRLVGFGMIQKKEEE